MTQGCKYRHPKDCYFWTKKKSGCSRGTSCKYFHSDEKRFKSFVTETIDTKKVFSCDHCDKAYIDINVLKIHKEIKHEMKNEYYENLNTRGHNYNFPCEICQKVFL